MTAPRTAFAGVIGAAVLAACLLVPGLRLGAHHPWLGALVLILPVAVLLAGTGFHYYGAWRAVAVAVTVTLAAEGVSWAVALFTLVKALSGEGIAPVWAILLFVTPAVSVLLLGAAALRIVRPVRRSSNPPQG
jgi:hypothetical protein